ncbi:MAG: UvrD-helicase domain-containing protein [Chthoniobacterales bacterium]
MDEAARTLFRTALDRNFCVIAGAGSGKTAAIVERICELAIQDPGALRRLVVVTYTNSAALAFKRRSRQRLLGAVSEADALIYLRALEQAYFGTIHGFCLNLIHEFKGRLSLPEQLRVPADAERDLLWEMFAADSPELDQLAEHPVTHALLRVCTMSDLLDVAKRFRPSAPLDPPSGRMPLPDLKKIDAIAVPKQSEKKKRSTVEGVEAFLKKWASGSGFNPLPKWETSKLRPEFEAQMAPVAAWLEEAAEWFADRLSRSFRTWCSQQGILSYADQIDVCVELLKQRDVLDQVRRRECIVIVDEAQDTDTRMFQVFIELTRPPGERFGDWPGSGKPPLPGRFCLVGDPRQTIYERNRTGRFAELSEYFDSGNELIRFNVTYRCAGDIVRRINEFFRWQAVEGIPFDDLAAGAEAQEGFVAKLSFALDEHIEAEDEIEPLVLECEAVAKWLSQVQPSDRPSWNNVAVIAPRHEWLIIAGDALKKFAVPFSFFRPKISRAGIAAFAWPVSLIYTLLNPWDRFERLGVLRELFGVSDTDLFLAQKGNPGKLFRESEGMLDAARQECVSGKRPSLLFLFDRLLERFRLRERLIAVGEDFGGLDQLRWEAARADERGLDLEEWLAELLSWLQESAQPSKAPAQGVELITTHSAKGLEWEWVIPIGFRKKFSHRNERYPRVQSEENCHVVWSNLSRRAQRDEEARRIHIKRLLYVTLTRAKTGLFLPTPAGAYNPGKQGIAFSEVVSLNCSELPSVDEVFQSGRADAKTAARRCRAAGPAAETPFAAAEAVSSVPQPPRLVRPHQLADDSPVLHLQFAEAAGSYDYGKWWHSWIEMFPWSDPTGEWECYGKNAAPPISYRQRAEREIAVLLANDELRQLCRNAVWFQSEFPFSWPKAAEDWYEGVIDLLIGFPDGTVYVIDWKTNQAASNESPEQLAQHLRNQYLPQLETYQEALQSMMEPRKIEIAIYSTVLGRFV